MTDVRGTGFLTMFDDPPEDPLREGGNWYPPFLGDHGTGTWYLDMQKAGGTASDGDHATTLGGIIGYSYWTPETFQGNAEVWGIATGGQLGAALETWRLFMWEQLSPPRGYLVYWGGGISKATVIRKYAGDWSYTEIGGTSSGYYPGFGLLRIHGTQVEVWDTAFNDMNPANMVQQLSVTDESYRGPFYIGMGIEDPTNGGLGWTAFGGGKKRNTQIYRYVRN